MDDSKTVSQVQGKRRLETALVASLNRASRSFPQKSTCVALICKIGVVPGGSFPRPRRLKMVGGVPSHQSNEISKIFLPDAETRVLLLFIFFTSWIYVGFSHVRGSVWLLTRSGVGLCGYGCVLLLLLAIACHARAMAKLLGASGHGRLFAPLPPGVSVCRVWPC